MREVDSWSFICRRYVTNINNRETLRLVERVRSIPTSQIIHCDRRTQRITVRIAVFARLPRSEFIRASQSCMPDREDHRKRQGKWVLLAMRIEPVARTLSDRPGMRRWQQQDAQRPSPSARVQSRIIAVLLSPADNEPFNDERLTDDSGRCELRLPASPSDASPTSSKEGRFFSPSPSRKGEGDSDGRCSANDSSEPRRTPLHS
jgi:hypothetical protein